MELTVELWNKLDPATQQTAGKDARALLVLKSKKTAAELATLLSYDSPRKINYLRQQGRQLLADARAGDYNAMIRVRRAKLLLANPNGRSADVPRSVVVRAENAAVLLTSGHVRVRSKTFEAEVRSSDGSRTYTVRYPRLDGTPGWSCSCPARVRCKHLVACQEIWAPEAPTPPTVAGRAAAAERVFSSGEES